MRTGGAGRSAGLGKSCIRRLDFVDILGCDANGFAKYLFLWNKIQCKLYPQIYIVLWVRVFYLKVLGYKVVLPIRSG